MAENYERIGGGSFGVYKPKKDEPNIWSWVIGIIVVLFLIGLFA